ncbi:hypothetical protein MBLNU459_g2781t1 [Dothideomycetes sp. NU459]
MFYVMYLTGLCSRRHWPEPLYLPTTTRNGAWTCVVRVNNREYTTEVSYATEALARDAAATQAYMICRSFSSNDGMYPGQRPGGHGVQGMPVAIGSGRRGAAKGLRLQEVGVGAHDDGRATSTMTTAAAAKRDSYAEGMSSGGESPKSVDSAVGIVDKQKKTRMCPCRRASLARPYERCDLCLREMAWSP